MKLVGRVPVEPLSDERMTNIERAIVAGAADAAATRTRESRWPVLGFAAVTIVLVVGAGLVGWRLRGGGETVVAEAAPLVVKTEANATTLDIGDAKIASDPSTGFTITRPGTGVLIAMTRGKVGLEVGKRSGREPLIVRAGDTDVIVVGTQFSVDFGDGSGKVDVRVTEGKVKVVRNREEPTLVAAGEAWHTDHGKIALADANTLIAKADRKVDDIVIPVDMGKNVDLHGRTAQVPDARIPTNGSGSAKTQAGSESGRPTLEASNDPSRDLKAAIRRQPVTAALDVHLDPHQSIQKYLEMAARGAKGDQASHAFYSIAVVQHLKLGGTEQDNNAVRTLDAYFRRFLRDAPEYHAARWLQVRIKCLRKIDDQCRQAAATYAHQAPASPTRTLADQLSTARGD